MFGFLNNMPIFRRLSILFAFAAVVPGIVIVLLGTFYLQSIGVRGQAVQTSLAAQAVATQEQTNLQVMNGLLDQRFAQVFAQTSPAVNGDSALLGSGALAETNIQVLVDDFNQSLIDYRQNYELATSGNMNTIRNILQSDAPDSQQIIDQQTAALNAVDSKSSTEWVNYRDLQSQVIRDLNPVGGNPVFSTSYEDLFKADNNFLPLKNSWQQVVNSAQRMGGTVTNIGPSLTTPFYVYTVAAFVFIILIIIATGYIVNSTITTPLRQLARLTRRISTGDTNERANVRGRDEISVVSASLNTMLDFMVRLTNEARNRNAALQTQIEKLVNEVSGVGEGDLSVQAEVTTDELGVLADSFNYMTEELGNLVVRVQTMAHEVEQATSLNYEQMSQLVQQSDTQIQQIFTATTEVGEMATSSRKVAERAQTLSEVARNAYQTTRGGHNAVRQTIEGIARINENVHSTSEKVQLLGERSREISNIVKVIAGLAHQTNRLALDAAIQAAMAGENGKGFQAVASDIRRLAERSKEQTLAIGQIVQQVLEDIHSAAVAMSNTEREASVGTQLVGEAGKALESIFSVVEHQASEMVTINQVAMQQLQSSNAVVQIMQNVSDSTQQSTGATREASRQMERLAQLAGQLLASVDVFKLPGNQRSALENGRPAFSQQGQQGFDRRGFNSQPPVAFSQPLRSGFLPAPGNTNNRQSPFYPERQYSAPSTPEPMAPQR